VVTIKTERTKQSAASLSFPKYQPMRVIIMINHGHGMPKKNLFIGNIKYVSRVILKFSYIYTIPDVRNRGKPSEEYINNDSYG